MVYEDLLMRSADNLTVLVELVSLNKSRGTEMVKLPPLPGRLLCWPGFPDFRVVDLTFEFGADAVEKC